MPLRSRFRVSRELQPFRRPCAFPKGEPVPCGTFEDTLQTVKAGGADYGVVPVYPLYGRITDIYHLLPESGLFIIGEHFLPIEMNLLGVPGATLKDVKSVQSLSVALGSAASSSASTGSRPSMRSIRPAPRGRSPKRVQRRSVNASSPSKSMGSTSSSPISRMRHTTPPASLSSRATRRRRSPAGARSRPPSSSASATYRGPSTRRWALCDQRRH